MKILEILENYNNIMLQAAAGSISDDIQKKIDILEKLFSESKNFLFSESDGIEILKLHYKCGMSYEKVSEELNLSISTVYRKRKKEIYRLQKYVFNEL